MAVKADLTPSPNPLPLSAAERGRGPGGRGEVKSNIVELFTPIEIVLPGHFVPASPRGARPEGLSASADNPYGYF